MSDDGSPARLDAFARILRRFAVPVVLFWIALTAVANVVAPELQELSKTESVSLNPPDAPSMIAMKRIGRDFRQFDSDATAMVVIEGQQKLGDEAHRFYDRLIARLSQDRVHVEHIDNFWADRLTAAGSQSVDGKAAYAQLYLAGDIGGSRARDSILAVREIVDGLPPPPGLRAYVTGPAPLSVDLDAYGDRSLQKITIATVVVIAIMLLLVYRSISTVVLILATVGIELAAVTGVIAVLASNKFFALTTFATSLLIPVAIAAATDYVIFLVGRYQEARAAGADREAAYHSMFRGTVYVILGSGTTVAGALFCLSLARLPYFQSLGWPCSIGLLVAVVASLTLAPAVVWIASRFGAFESRTTNRTRWWRRVGTIVVRWPGPVLVATVLMLMVGLLALPKYETNYNDRYYIPGAAPSSVGYRAADRHFAQARMEPEVLMIEADHDLRNPTDMLILDRIAKNVFHLPGIARVQSITRPLGGPIDHTSIPFQIGMESAMTQQNLKGLKDRVADMTKLTDAMQQMIEITERTESLQRQLADTTHEMNLRSQRMRATANELRDRLADFDDVWRPVRNYFYWDRHCFNIPVCSSLRSLYDATDGVDKLTEDLGSFADSLAQFDTLQPQLLSQVAPMIATMRLVKGLAQTLTSSFSGMVTQMEKMARNGTVMGEAFDNAKNDDSFYLPPEAFENPDFQRGLTLFLSPDGDAARFVITHQGDPATAVGISHIDPIMQAATEAVKGTPLAEADFYLAGTASTYKDIRDGSTYDLLIVVVASLCLIFIIMLAITKSVVAAAVIIGTVTLSLASSCGLSVLVWQHILHMPLNWFVLAMAVIVMLAVGSDYNLLLVARFQEEIGAGINTGIIRSMAGTGRVVTTAGLVFAVTMGAMVSSDLRVIGQIGTTIMIGLLSDILIVRSFMTPAIAALLGRWFWWPQVVRSRAVQTRRAPSPSPSPSPEQQPVGAVLPS